MSEEEKKDEQEDIQPEEVSSEKEAPQEATNETQEEVKAAPEEKKKVEELPQEETSAKSAESSEKASKEEASADSDQAEKAKGENTEGSEKGGRGRRGGGSQRPQGRRARKAPEASEFMEKILSIKRVTKVTKGGKKLSFSALAVVGDTKGKVGYSLGKGGEVAVAIRKALIKAKKNMIAVPMQGSTITHEIIGECGGAEVMLKPASEGTGVIASGPVRAVCDGAGIHNILTKCHRSNNPINVVKATINGLSRLKTRENDVAQEVVAAVEASTDSESTEESS